MRITLTEQVIFVNLIASRHFFEQNFGYYWGTFDNSDWHHRHHHILASHYTQFLDIQIRVVTVLEFQGEVFRFQEIFSSHLMYLGVDRNLLQVNSIEM